MSGFVKGADDWICPDGDCKNVNYARRTHCHRCKVERKDARKASSWEKKKLGTEIGKQAADKSRGLFSAEDWQCTQCANVNWSRRQSCNMCNAPKFHDTEERTGTGGGYNERMNVEYKEKVPSDDDEFDEFGRRKKKNSINQTSPPNGSRKRLQESEEKDEDDDDEDDEEGDLSKYNLWDSDEAGEDASNGKQGESEKTSLTLPSSSSSSSIKRNEPPRRRSESRSSSRSPRSRHSSSNRRKRKYSRSSSSGSSVASPASSRSSSTSSTRRRRRRY